MIPAKNEDGVARGTDRRPNVRGGKADGSHVDRIKDDRAVVPPRNKVGHDTHDVYLPAPEGGVTYIDGEKIATAMESRSSSKGRNLEPLKLETE